MRSFTIAAFAVALVASIAWAIAKPGWDTGVAVAVAFAALLASFFLGKDGTTSGQQQHVEKGGMGIQAGRDISIRDIKRDK